MNDEPEIQPEAESEDAEARMRAMSRRSFVWAGAAIVGTLGAYRFISTRRQENEIPWPLRRTLEANEEVAKDLIDRHKLAPTFSQADVAPEPRVNGQDGLDEAADFTDWTLTVQGLATGKDVEVGLDAIKAMPSMDLIVQLNCVEGWTQVMSWRGVPLIDFIGKYPPNATDGQPADVHYKPSTMPPYIAMESADMGYYVGLDMQSCLHPQSILAYEMNGKPLSWDHGAPLRLVMPIKYGYKQIKRIDTIRYSTDRPPDFWADQGYDWYGGF